ncbi:DUF6361 family protein [Desulfohalobium retbaense]|uniref:Uncharacterized protein n=1 Tax=Desulfohalobium retbaense (strain ATCC 49708 / DSM 5692 / JCM 16813 / HR100) TaxID=485915 RepID=C8X329_DESRD|nr:DUF6361 family protein [Desulfohalobium retbaense]ACV68826.1 conserved hypothetical protein [Desulfohalobium retbaense DSM 5692]
MASTFAWLDYCESERRKALDVIQAFGDQGTLDELGIGTTRDALSDLLFPGTSTIQTRAKYHLFIPWMYQELERECARGRLASQYAIEQEGRSKEVALIQALASSSDPVGTIGVEAKAKLRRLPSSVYWNGLGHWGIRLFSGTQDQYHESLALASEKCCNHAAANESEPFPSAWHPGLPPRPDDFPRQAEFALSFQQAEYLQDRVMARNPGTFLAFLVERGHPSTSIDFPWNHPQYAEVPLHLQDQLRHSRNFSEIIHGAALLYNLMLAEKLPSEKLQDDYRDGLSQWAAMIDGRRDELATWDLEALWSMAEADDPRVPEHSKRFIRDWRHLVMDKDDPAKIIENQQARVLLSNRERSLKKNLARLHNPRALELWSGKSGTDRLDFRWKVVQQLMEDIRRPLMGGEGYA